MKHFKTLKQATAILFAFIAIVFLLGMPIKSNANELSEARTVSEWFTWMQEKDISEQEKEEFKQCETRFQSLGIYDGTKKINGWQFLDLLFQICPSE